MNDPRVDAAYRYLERCYLAGDSRSPLALLREVLSVRDALMLLPDLFVRKLVARP
jgi:hypothetical protein